MIMFLPVFSASPARAACNPPDPRTATATDNYPVNHADINPLDVRSYTPITGAHNLIDFVHEADPNAMPPQLSTLIEGNATPNISSLNQVCMWNWSGDTGQGSRGGPIEKPSDAPSDFATLVGLSTTAGQVILVPRSGYDIGGGRTAMVLYATANSITLKYTAEDDMIAGYGIHLSNFNVDQKLIDYYNQLNNQGRNELPVLCSGFKLGVALNGEIQVAIRDTGSFMDPRWRDPGGKNDWWQITTPATAATQCELTSTKVEQTVSRASKIGVDGPLYGRDPYDRLKIRENAAEQARLAQKVSRYDIIPYCPAMGVNQPDGSSPISLDQYKYCTKDESRFAVEGRGFISCPDYSPNRPYPGDTCINYTDIKATNVTVFSQPVFEIGRDLTYDLCRKEKSSIPGVPASFPCLPQKYTVLVPQKKQVTYDKAFVEYLGTNNEYTSNPNAIMSLKNNIARTSQYLTDYLGAFAHAPGVRDRSRAMAEFLRAIYDYKLVADNSLATQAQKDAAYQTFQATLAKIENLKEILQLTSGAMAKLSPQKWAEVQFDSNKVLLGRWLASNLPSTEGEKPKDKVEKTPIGDYVVAWTCPETVNEEEFGDSLDRTEATIKAKGKTKDCKNPHPIRISEFICGNADAWADAKATFGLLADEICRGKKTGSSEGEAQFVYWPNFMPLTTREDTPVRVQISCESSKNEKGEAPPYPYASEMIKTERELRDFMVSKNTPDGDTYYIDNPNKTPGNPYLVISRKFIYVGHLAEARELSYYVGNALLPKAMQDTALKNPKMDELDPAIASGDVKTAVAQTGDLIAEDAKLRYFKDSDKVQVVTAINKDHGSPPTWGGSGNPPNATVNLSNKCTIQVEMPYIAEVAARTIGKDAGFMRLFLPETVGDDLSKNIRSQANKGAGVALSSYASEHDFIRFVDESGNEVWTAAGEPGVDRAEGRIYIPWVKEMQAFQTVAMGYGLNPAKVQIGRDVIVPGTGTTANAAWQQCMTKDVDFKNTNFDDAILGAALERMWSKISGETYGTNYLSTKSHDAAKAIWIEMGGIARAGGINPILALAYWGEETHYTSQTSPGNPNPKMAIGCGAPPGGSTCIKSSTPAQELREEFQCIAASNSYGCNLSSACSSATSTTDFMGCYHNGAGNPAGDDHLGNVMTFYYQMLGQSVPDCFSYK
jgi:hypothetical protein